MSFLDSFLSKPSMIGAVAPSGRQLARRMVAAVGGHPAEGGVVEVGAGTGAFTGEILRTLQPPWFVALEPHAPFAGVLRARFPDVDVDERPVEQLSEVLAERGYSRAQAVVSGLPFALWPSERQERAVSAIAASLEPDGCMVTFGYLQSQLLPASGRLRRLLEARFREVRIVGFAWCNLPPALVIAARGTLQSRAEAP